MGTDPSPIRSPRLRLELALVAGGSFLLLAATVLLHRWSGMSYRDLMADPAAVTGSPAYLGFLSNLGILLWGAAAGVSLFAATVVGRGAGPRWRAFLAASGLMTLAAGLDDLFLVHERVLPTTLGVEEPVTYAAYALVGAVYLVAFGGVIRQGSLAVLLLALGCFALSIGLDVMVDPEEAAEPVEDGAKAVGLVSWVVYLAGVSRQAILRGRVRSPSLDGGGTGSAYGASFEPRSAAAEASPSAQAPFA